MYLCTLSLNMACCCHLRLPLDDPPRRTLPACLPDPLPRHSVSRGVQGPPHPPGTDLRVNITLAPNLNPLAGVALTYVVGFGAPQQVDAAPAGDAEQGR